MAQYGQSQMSKAPNALDYLKKKEQEKKKFNLFDFSDVAPKPQLNFGPGMSGPGITNFQDLKASIPQQAPQTQPTQKSGFSLVPTANAMEEEDLLQQYLKDTKQDNNSKQQLFQALQDGESPDDIINYLQTSGYKGNQPTQEQPGIFGKLKESAISSLPSPKAIGEVGLNILGGIEKNITGAVNIATSPFGVEPMRTPSETIRGVEKATPSLIERTIDNVLKGGEYQGEIWEGQINKEQGPESTTFQTLGNIGKTLIGDILGDAFISGLSTLSTKDQKEFAKQELEKLLNTKGAKYIQEKIDKINKDYEDLKEYDPGLARNYKAGKDITMSFLDLIGFKATKSAGKITKETLENIPTNIPESIQKTGEVLTKGEKQVIDKLTPDLQQKAYDISTKANRFVGEDIRKFYEITGESPGEFAVKRGMTKTGDEAVDEATKNWITSMKQADDALEQVGGNFKIQQGPDFIDGALKGLQKKLSKYSPEIDRVNQLVNKYRTEGLTMPEINEVKRLYASNHKYNWLDAGSKQATTSRDIQDGLRKWQFAKAKEMGLQNLDEINKNTQGWRAFADNLAKKLKRSEGNNNISLTDWVSLSGGNPTNIALFLGKKAGESAKFKEFLIRKFGKQTKDAIIKPNINKPQIKGLLPQPGQTSKGPIVTPQTAEKGAILESKIPLKKTKYGTNSNIPSNMNNTRMETILKPNQPTNVSNKPLKKTSETGGKVLKKILPSNFKEKAQDLFDKVAENTGGKTNLLPTNSKQVSKVSDDLIKFEGGEYFKKGDKYFKRYTGLFGENKGKVIEKEVVNPGNIKELEVFKQKGMKGVEELRNKQLQEFKQRQIDRTKEKELFNNKKENKLNINDLIITKTKLPNYTLYHGTSSINLPKILKEGFKAGNELPENAFRGGGHGAIQNSISFSLDPKISANFTGTGNKGGLITVTINKDANIVKIPQVEGEYAEYLNDIIPDLKKKGIDAIYIGGEDELVVINKNIIKITGSREFNVGKTNQELKDIFEQANKPKLLKKAK